LAAFEFLYRKLDGVIPNARVFTGGRRDLDPRHRLGRIEFSKLDHFPGKWVVPQFEIS
jgi:hypothetical protein